MGNEKYMYLWTPWLELWYGSVCRNHDIDDRWLNEVDHADITGACACRRMLDTCAKFPIKVLVSRDRLVVRTLRCGRSNPGSNPGHGNFLPLALFTHLFVPFLSSVSSSCLFPLFLFLFLFFFLFQYMYFIFFPFLGHRIPFWRRHGVRHSSGYGVSRAALVTPWWCSRWHRDRESWSAVHVSHLMHNEKKSFLIFAEPVGSAAGWSFNRNWGTNV